jgi:hypothetical protein
MSYVASCGTCTVHTRTCTSLLTDVVPPTLSVTTGFATPSGGVMLKLRSGMGNPLVGLPAVRVWKLTVISPAGRCRLVESGIGTSPYASYSSRTNAFRMSDAIRPMPAATIDKTATMIAIRGPNRLPMGEVCHASVCAAAPIRD